MGAPGGLRSPQPMAAAKNVVCPSCGFAKNPPGSTRCVSCGAKIEALGKTARTKEEELEWRYQQEGMNVTWLLISIGVQGPDRSSPSAFRGY